MLDGEPSPATRAYLRVVNPSTGTSVLPVTGGGTVTVQNLSVDAPTTVTSGGGLFTTLTVPLPSGELAPNATVNISVTFAIDQPGSYWFGYDVQALEPIEAAAANTESAGAGVDDRWAQWGPRPHGANGAAGDSGIIRAYGLTA